MTPILIGLGDIHIRKEDWYMEGFNSFIEYIDHTLPDSAKSYTEVFLPGDIAENIFLLPITSAMITRFIHILQKKASTVYVVVGNHDFGLVNYKVKSLRPFLENLGVVVIKQVSVVTTKLGFKVLCIPHKPSQTFAELNEELTQFTDEYDCVVAHREVHPMIGSDECMDISRINSHCYFLGHIHSHGNDSKYLGSILPNKIDEVKKNDPSVMRIYRQDTKTYTDFTLPDFIDIQKVYVSSYEDIRNIIVEPHTYYSFIIKGNCLSTSDVKHYCTLNSIPMYSCDYEETDTKPIVSEDTTAVTIQRIPTLSEFIQLYKDDILKLGMTEDRYQLASNLILSIN